MNCDLHYFEGGGDTRSFRVLVHDCAVEHLLADAQEAYRVYEMLTLSRPGDVCKYLWVELIEVPDWIRRKAAEQREQTKFPIGKEWPENFVPLVDFDQYFRWGWEDTPSLDRCWLQHRESDTFREEIFRVFRRVMEGQQRVLASQDLLVRAEVESKGTHLHPYDINADPPFRRTRPDYRSPTIPQRTPAYYDKLRGMLARPDLESLIMSGEAPDFQVFRLICATQAERAKTSAKHPFVAFPIGISSDCHDWLGGWPTQFIQYSEGLGYGDIWILNDVDCGDHMRWLVEKHGNHHKWFLFYEGAEAIPGYRITHGEGWTVLEDETEDRDYRKWGKASLQARFQRMWAHEINKAAGGAEKTELKSIMETTGKGCTEAKE